MNFSGKNHLSEADDWIKRNIGLEQYPLPMSILNNLLELARKDIFSKAVIDLGCGSGRIALAVAMRGAKMVLGVDIDPRAIQIARRAANKVSLNNISWIAIPVEFLVSSRLHGEFDTAMMNPPFGTKGRKGIDRAFLRKALHICPTVYAIHQIMVRKHFRQEAKKQGFKMEIIGEGTIEIPRTFTPHRKSLHSFKIDISRFKVNYPDLKDRASCESSEPHTMAR